MHLDQLRSLVEPDLTRKGLKWNNVAYVEFFPQYYEVTLFIRGFDGKMMYNPREDDAYKTTVRFEYKELDNGVVEDQSVQEQSGEEASGRCRRHPACTCTSCRAPGDGDTPGSTREGPGDGQEAEARAEASRKEAEAARRRFNRLHLGYDCDPITACGPFDQRCDALGPCCNHR